VQIDFTEGQLAVKIDPSGNLLHRFIDLNNLALTRFSAEEQRRIGIHTCPGSDRDSTSDRNIEHARAESEDMEGRDYSLRVRPYRTTDNKIDGAVLTLVDLEGKKESYARKPPHHTKQVFSHK